MQRDELLQFPGFITAPWGRKICSRCHSEYSNPFYAWYAGSDCLLCHACRSMGEHRSCSTLLALANGGRAGLKKPRAGLHLQLSHKLTHPQQQASEELLKFWKQGTGKALVWAACSAGKTEVTFALIRQALRRRREVLFAIPRQDIVRK